MRIVRITLTTALLTLLATLLGGTATATTGYGSLSTTQDNSVCDALVVRIDNTTRHTYSADFRFPGDVGTPDEYSELTVSEGPLVGLKFGNRYGAVDVPPGGAEWYFDVATFPELAGLEYRVARGPEQKVYFNWTSVDLRTCETPTTTTSVPDSTTTDPTTTDPTTTTTEPPTSSSDEPTTTTPITTTGESTSTTATTTLKVKPRYANCDDVRKAGQAPIRVGTPGFHPDLDTDGDGFGCEREETVSNVSHDDRDLASTGATGIGPLVAIGTLLLVGGTIVAVAIRRRRTDGAA